MDELIDEHGLDFRVEVAQESVCAEEKEGDTRSIRICSIHRLTTYDHSSTFQGWGSVGQCHQGRRRCSTVSASWESPRSRPGHGLVYRILRKKLRVGNLLNHDSSAH